MKNHVAFKFLAILLCALTLLASILCVIGIVVLEQQELYEKNLQQQFQLRDETIYGNIAQEIARRYASQTLGGCDEALIDAYYGSNWQEIYLKDGYYFYTIRDAAGNEYSTYQNQAVDRQLEQKVTGSYLRQIAVNESDKGSQYVGDYLIEATEPNAPEGAYNTIHLYASKLGIYLAYQYDTVQMPDMTVTLYLMEGARRDTEAQEWAMLLWQNRYNLIYILIGSLLLFAIGAVYLCCAAGKRPGSDEVSPGGFNLLPLDLYALGGGLLIYLSLLLIPEVYNWLDHSSFIFYLFLLFVGFFDCLIFVAFCFACAAQFKTPGYYWLKNTVVGFSCIVFWETATVLWELLGKAAKWLWKTVPLGLGGICRAGWGLLKDAWDCAKRIARFLWAALCRLAAWLWQQLQRFFRFVGRCIRQVCQVCDRALSLLPLTWQWLLMGFVLVFMLYMCLRTYRVGWILLGFGIFFAVILYSSNAFGILLEAAKRMGQGDLETKVSDQFLIGSFRDFAGDLNALADVAKVAAQKEMRSERMKTELITNVSHDIKTPLTSIINYVDLLQKPHTPEEELEYLEVLGRKSEQLKKLIQDLMEMSKASTGNMAVDIRSVDAAEAVNQALGEFADKLASGNLTPVFHAPEEPVVMLADGRLVWRVLNNLLSNAVKYAMPGTRLYVAVEKRQDTVQISLKNISAEPLNVDAAELMERFVRGDAARNTDGSGLGLNIAKSLMEVQHGKLELAIDGDLFKATLILPAVQSEKL